MSTADCSPDGNRVVTGASDGTLTIWDVGFSEELLTLSGHDGPVVSVNFSPDGRRIYSAALDGIRVWDEELRSR